MAKFVLCYLNNKIIVNQWYSFISIVIFARLGIEKLFYKLLKTIKNGYTICLVSDNDIVLNKANLFWNLMLFGL